MAIGVALDVSPLFRQQRPVSGIPHVAASLLRTYSLAGEIEVVPFLYDPDGDAEAPSQFGAQALQLSANPVVAASSPADLGRVDVVHFTYWFHEHLLPPAARPVLTVHDVRPLLYPAFYAEDGSWLRDAMVRCWTRAGTVAVFSRTVAAEVEGYFGTRCGSIRVIDPLVYSADEEAARPAGVPVPFCLLLGTEHAVKNHLFVLAAWRRAHATNADRRLDGLHLVLAGARGSASEAIDAFVARDDADGIVRLGEVSEPEKRWLIANATCVLQMSFHEGLGLPLLEAADAGKPVIASDIAVHRELCTPGVHLIPFGDADEMLRRLAQIAEGHQPSAEGHDAAAVPPRSSDPIEVLIRELASTADV